MMINEYGSRYFDQRGVSNTLFYIQTNKDMFSTFNALQTLFDAFFLVSLSLGVFCKIHLFFCNGVMKEDTKSF